MHKFIAGKFTDWINWIDLHTESSTTKFLGKGAYESD